MVKEVAVGAPEISQRSRYSTLPQRPWLLVCWALFARGVTSCITECFNGVLLKYYYFRTCYFFNFYAFFLCVIGVVFISKMNKANITGAIKVKDKYPECRIYGSICKMFLDTSRIKAIELIEKCWILVLSHESFALAHFSY